MFIKKSRIGIVIFSDTTLSITAYRTEKKFFKNHCSFIAETYAESKIPPYTIIQGRPFNFFRLKNLLTEQCIQLSLTPATPFLIGINGDVAQEHLLMHDSASCTSHPLFQTKKKTDIISWQYLFSLPGTRHLLYMNILPSDVLFQYKLLFTSLNLKIINGSLFFSTLLALIYKMGKIEQLKQILTASLDEKQSLSIIIERLITTGLSHEARKLVQWHCKDGEGEEKNILHSIGTAIFSGEIL